MRKSKIIAFIYIVLCCIPLFGINASASYIDPSVATYTVQVIAGIVIACGAVLFVWWRKVKSKVSKKLGIDENAGKEVEEELVIKEDTNDKIEEPSKDENNGEIK